MTVQVGGASSGDPPMSIIHFYDDLLASFTPRCRGLGFTLRGLVWFYFEFFFLAEVRFYVVHYFCTPTVLHIVENVILSRR